VLGVRIAGAAMPTMRADVRERVERVVARVEIRILDGMGESRCGMVW
jgi:hypothetical protein